MAKPIIPPDTVTDHGTVIAVGSLSGERYYWLNDKGTISMLPADVVEA